MKRERVIALMLTASMLLGGCGGAAKDAGAEKAPEEMQASGEDTSTGETEGEVSGEVESLGGGEPMELECMVDMNKLVE